MLVKGTKEYEVAGKLSKEIIRYANYERWNDNSYFNMAFEELGRFVYEITKLDGFASQVAKTVDKTMDVYGKKVAYISDKQAWILACAAIENGIEWEGITNELHTTEVVDAEVEHNEEVSEVQELEAENEEQVIYNVGDVIEHSKFGEGTITEVTEDKLTIDFKEFTKTIIIKFSNIKIKFSNMKKEITEKEQCTATEKKLVFLVKSPCYKANGYDGAYYSVAFTNENGDVIKGFGDHISELSYGIRNVFEAEGTSFSDEDRFISIQKIEINEKKFDAFVKKYQEDCALSDKITSERLKRFGDSPYNYVYEKKEGQAERLKEYEEWKKANPYPKDIYYDFLKLIK